MVIRAANPNAKPSACVDNPIITDEMECISTYVGQKGNTQTQEQTILITLINPDDKSPIYAVYLERGSEGISMRLVIKDDAFVDTSNQNPTLRLADESEATLHNSRERLIPKNTNHTLFLNQKMGIPLTSGQNARELLDEVDDPEKIKKVINTLRQSNLLSDQKDIRSRLCDRMEDLLLSKKKPVANLASNTALLPPR